MTWASQRRQVWFDCQKRTRTGGSVGRYSGLVLLETTTSLSLRQEVAVAWVLERRQCAMNSFHACRLNATWWLGVRKPHQQTHQQMAPVVVEAQHTVAGSTAGMNSPLPTDPLQCVQCSSGTSRVATVAGQEAVEVGHVLLLMGGHLALLAEEPSTLHHLSEWKRLRRACLC